MQCHLSDSQCFCGFFELGGAAFRLVMVLLASMAVSVAQSPRDLPEARDKLHGVRHKLYGPTDRLGILAMNRAASSVVIVGDSAGPYVD